MATMTGRPEPIHSDRALFNMYNEIPLAFKISWISNHQTFDDPFGERDPTTDDIRQIASDWVNEPNDRLDPFMQNRNNIHTPMDINSRKRELNSEIISWLQRNHPIQESFLENHCDMHKISALDGLVNCIKRVQEIGFQAEVKTAVSGINKELKQLEEEKNELHNRRSQKHQQRNERNGAGQKTDSFRSFDEDVPF